MNPNSLSSFVLLGFTCVAVGAQDVVAFAADSREGVFEVTLPSSYTRASKSKLDELQRTMMAGAKQLAETSRLGDPVAISEKAVSFLSAYQNQNKKLLLVLFGMQSPVVLDRDEMYRSNTERIKWGIDTGRLKKTSKGVSKLSIDGVPCLLVDMTLSNGGRLQTYLFFFKEAPRAACQCGIICDDDATYDANAQDIKAIISSLKVIRKRP